LPSYSTINIERTILILSGDLKTQSIKLVKIIPVKSYLGYFFCEWFKLHQDSVQVRTDPPSLNCLYVPVPVPLRRFLNTGILNEQMMLNNSVTSSGKLRGVRFVGVPAEKITGIWS
jgi:hypothetical protein